MPGGETCHGGGFSVAPGLARQALSRLIGTRPAPLSRKVAVWTPGRSPRDAPSRRHLPPLSPFRKAPPPSPPLRKRTRRIVNANHHSRRGIGACTGDRRHQLSESAAPGRPDGVIASLTRMVGRQSQLRRVGDPALGSIRRPVTSVTSRLSRSPLAKAAVNACSSNGIIWIIFTKGKWNDEKFGNPPKWATPRAKKMGIQRAEIQDARTAPRGYGVRV